MNIKNEIIEEKFNEYVSNHQRQYYSYLEPFTNRYLVALYNRQLLPSFISKSKRLLLLNVLRCEAHRDVLIKLLKH